MKTFNNFLADEAINNSISKGTIILQKLSPNQLSPVEFIDAVGSKGAVSDMFGQIYNIPTEKLEKIEKKKILSYLNNEIEDIEQEINRLNKSKKLGRKEYGNIDTNLNDMNNTLKRLKKWKKTAMGQS